MKIKRPLVPWIALLAIVILNLQLTPLVAQTTSFTYQGQLTENGSPANGTYDLRFELFDAVSAGSQQGSTITTNAVPVSGGLFTVTLDFGSAVFATGANRWLEISSRTNGPDAFGTLTPRQQITSAPYAIKALTASTNTGTMSASQVTSGILAETRIDSALARDSEVTALLTTYQPLDADLTDLAADGSLTGSKVGTGINADNIATGNLDDERLTSNVALLNRTPQAFTGTNIFNNRVGIGTTTPALKLSVAGSGSYNSANAAAILLTNTTPNGHGWEWHSLDSGSFQLADFNVGATRLLVDTNGNVGIGTASPESDVHILRASAGSVTPSTSSLLTLENSASAFMHILVPDTANSGILFGTPLTANDASIRYNNGADRELSFRTLNSTRMVILTNGFVGVNTLNPTNTLHVVGGATFTSGAGGANQNVVWTPGSASWSFTSDRNSKERLASINQRDVLAKVCGLPITEWSYIGYEQRHIGPMAQDFHAQFPLNGDDKALNDADLHGVALAAIQGLNQKLVDELQHRDAENTELKRTVNELKELVQTISRKVNATAK